MFGGFFALETWEAGQYKNARSQGAFFKSLTFFNGVLKVTLQKTGGASTTNVLLEHAYKKKKTKSSTVEYKSTFCVNCIDIIISLI